MDSIENNFGNLYINVDNKMLYLFLFELNNGKSSLITDTILLTFKFFLVFRHVNSLRNIK